MKFLKLVVACVMSAGALLAAAMTSSITVDEREACHKLQRVFSNVHGELKQGIEVLQYFISTPSTEHLRKMTSSLGGGSLSTDPLRLPLVIQDWDEFVRGQKAELKTVIESSDKFLARRDQIHRAFDWTIARYHFFMRDVIAVAGQTVCEFLARVRGRVLTEKDDYGIMITESDEDFLSSLVVPGFETAQLMAANVIRRLLYDLDTWEHTHKEHVLPGYRGDCSLWAFALGIDGVCVEGVAKPVNLKWLALLGKYGEPTVTRDQITALACEVRSTIAVSAREEKPFTPLVSIKRVPKRYVDEGMLAELNGRQFMPREE